MIGQATKFVGTFDTDARTYVFVEEHDVPALGALTAARNGSSHRRTEFGLETAQRKYATLCRRYPIGMPTPAMTSPGAVLL